MPEDQPTYDGYRTDPLPIRTLEDQRKHDFFMVDDVIADHYLKALDGTAVAVYLALLRTANKNRECWPGKEYLANMVGVSERTIFTALATLAGQDKRKDKDGKPLPPTLTEKELPPLIRIVERRREDGGKTSNLYQIRHVAAHFRTPPAAYFHGEVKPVAHEVDTSLRSKESTNVLSSAKPKRNDYPQDFQDFWAAYPKGHGSKKLAYTEWQKLDWPEKLSAMVGLKHWLRSKRWADGYIRDAERFLKHRMWENPPEEQATPLACAPQPTGEDPYLAQLMGGEE